MWSLNALFDKQIYKKNSGNKVEMRSHACTLFGREYINKYTRNQIWIKRSLLVAIRHENIATECNIIKSIYAVRARRRGRTIHTRDA